MRIEHTGLPFLAPQVPISLSTGVSVVLPNNGGACGVECVGNGGGQFDAAGVVGLVGQVVGGRTVDAGGEVAVGGCVVGAVLMP